MTAQFLKLPTCPYVDGLSRFLKVSSAKFPNNPDLEKDPKNTLIQLAKRSRIREIREDIVPINKNATIGANYNGCLIEFVYKFWNIENASTYSNSLMKAILKLQEFES